SVPMGVRVVTGISFGFVFYVLDQIFGPLTLVYGIPPIVGALLVLFHRIIVPGRRFHLRRAVDPINRYSVAQWHSAYSSGERGAL
ncbi:hypothetical protein MJM95_27835, partial [Salmonella enterica subsp. enterica serovar Anatum]|nr:hypothetical protein [Salmonella enterica subsp. enterica serovar Anatum]